MLRTTLNKAFKQTCQNNDWRVHKYECTALRKWGEKARQAGRGSGNPDVIVVPSDAIRALGRILWNIELDGLSSFLVRLSLSLCHSNSNSNLNHSG